MKEPVEEYFLGYLWGTTRSSSPSKGAFWLWDEQHWATWLPFSSSTNSGTFFERNERPGNPRRMAPFFGVPRGRWLAGLRAQSQRTTRNQPQDQESIHSHAFVHPARPSFGHPQQKEEYPLPLTFSRWRWRDRLQRKSQ